MEYHEVANIFPLMQGDEFEGLKADIARHGLQEPICVDQDGKIIDGRNRYRACMELGIEPHRFVVKFLQTAEELTAYVISKNLHRRHLNETQRGVIAAKMANMERGGDRPSQKDSNFESANLPNRNGMSQSDAADMMNVSDRTLRTVKQVEREAPELIPAMEAGQMTAHEASKQIRGKRKEQSRNEERKQRAETSLPESNIIHGDMREVSATIPDNSIDMILTDPPYAEEYLPLFADLSVLAARVLKPGGACVVYSGQIFLPEVMQRLGQHLEYLWTCAIRHTGGNQRIFKANVNAAWKPVLWYIKPPRSVYWDAFIDVASGGREKGLHDWQQAESEAAYFIEYICPEGGTVLDPFCGSGTVCVAAKRLGRHWIGIEIEEQYVMATRERLND